MTKTSGVPPLERLRALQQLAHARRCAALAAAAALMRVEEGELDFTPTAMLMDVDLVRATVEHLQLDAGFPTGALHTVAVKANPVGGVLKLFLEAGMGAEVASLGELAQALHVGFPPDRIVFDSPAKTRAELAYALERGVPVNLDNFQELERAAELIAAHPEWVERPGGSLVGLRVNPQVGAGSIAALSTGGAVSKFGFPLGEVRDELVAAFVAHPWLNMLHLHVGSQGMPTSLIVEGAARVWALLEDIDAACGCARVKALDIGGGLTVDFSTDDPGPLPADPGAAASNGEIGGGGAAASNDSSGEPAWTRFQEQASLLRARVPGLFDPSRGVRLMTENGRSLLAKAGCIVSRVEYTKHSGGRRIAVCHVGADLLTRACYMPETWGLRVRVCGPGGAPKEPGAPCSGEGSNGGGGAEDGGGCNLEVQDIAGPLCFQGDRLATAAALPRCNVGDWVMVLDAGAYTLAMASRYNSRCSPAVYGFESGIGGEGISGGGAALRKLRGRERLEDVLRYWNL